MHPAARVLFGGVKSAPETPFIGRRSASPTEEANLPPAVTELTSTEAELPPALPTEELDNPPTETKPEDGERLNTEPTEVMEELSAPHLPVPNVSQAGSAHSQSARAVSEVNAPLDQALRVIFRDQQPAADLMNEE